MILFFISIFGSTQRKHLQRINESLKDQVRLLKNQLSRQRQEFEETTEDLRKEIVIKDSAILSQRYENKTIVSTSIEKSDSKQDIRQFSSDKEDHDDCLKKDVSDKEVGWIDNIFMSFETSVIHQNINYLFIL